MKKSKSITELLNRISDPLVRAFESLRIAKQSQDQSKIESRAISLIENVMLLGEDKRFIELINEYPSDPFLDNFSNIPKKILPKLLISYADFRMGMSVKQLEGIHATIQFANQEDVDVEVKNSVLDRLYHTEIDFIIDTKIYPDENIINIFEYAKAKKNKALLKKVAKYCNIRLKSLEKPNSSDNLKDIECFWKIIQQVLPKKIQRAEELILATDILERRQTWGDNKFPSITRSDITVSMPLAVTIAVYLYSKQKKDLQFVYNLLKDNEDAELIKEHHHLPKMIESFVLEILKTKQTKDAFGCCRVILKNNCLKLQSKKVLQEVMLDLLVKGEIELADVVRDIMEWERDKKIISKAINIISKNISQKLLETSKFSNDLLSRWSYSFVSETKKLKSKEFEEAIALNKRVEYLEDYLQKGLRSIKSIMESNLNDEYSGKILLLDFQGSKFLRTLVGTESDMHSDILEKFNKEIKQLGFMNYPKPQGGAYIRINKDQKTILIHDRSEDFGECDKEITKSIIQRGFPDWIITTEKYKNGY